MNNLDIIEKALLLAINPIESVNDKCTHIEALAALKQLREQKPVELNDNEQYRMQMAAIFGASFGCVKHVNEVLEEHESPVLKDVIDLYSKYNSLYKRWSAIKAVLDDDGEVYVAHYAD